MVQLPDSEVGILSSPGVFFTGLSTTTQENTFPRYNVYSFDILVFPYLPKRSGVSTSPRLFSKVKSRLPRFRERERLSPTTEPPLQRSYGRREGVIANRGPGGGVGSRHTYVTVLWGPTVETSHTEGPERTVGVDRRVRQFVSAETTL